MIEWNLRRLARDLEATSTALMDGLEDGAGEAQRQWEAAYKPRRLQNRGEASTGPRTRALMESFVPQDELGQSGVTRTKHQVTLRTYFEGDEDRQKVVRTLERGAHIKAKAAKRPLRFLLERRYSRRAWTFPEATQWIAKYEVTVPPYLHLEDDWEAHVPNKLRCMERGVQDGILAAIGGGF